MTRLVRREQRYAEAWADASGGLPMLRRAGGVFDVELREGGKVRYDSCVVVPKTLSRRTKQ